MNNLDDGTGTNNSLYLADLARELAQELQSDIKLSTHREEHVRVTARANKALELANGLLEIK
jgi:hypothetical protein